MHVILSLGSNISSDYVTAAIEWLADVVSDMSVSSVYRTPAVKVGSRPYANAVAAGIIDMAPEMFNMALKRYEEQSGRNKEARLRGDVPIDIDIVVCDGIVVREWDFRQNFFKIGYSELQGSPVEK